MMYTTLYVLTIVATAYKIYRRWMYCAVRPCEKKPYKSSIYDISPAEMEKLLLEGLEYELQSEIEKIRQKLLTKRFNYAIFTLVNSKSEAKWLISRRAFSL